MRLAAVPPLVTALLYLLIGVFVLRQLRSQSKNALAYSLWLFTTVYWQLGWAVVFSLRDPTWVPFLVRLNYTGIVFIPIAFYHLFVTFLGSGRDRPWLKVAYGMGGFFALACWVDGWMVNGFYSYPWGYYARAGFLHPLYLIFLSGLVARTLVLLVDTPRSNKSRSSEQIQRRLLRWAFICYLPASFDFFCNYGIRLYPFGFLFTLLSLTLVSYAIIKHNLFDIRLIIQKTLIYSAVTLTLTAIYVALLVLTARTVERWGGNSSIYTSAFATAVIAILVHPVRSRTQAWIDRHFPRERLDPGLLREAAGGFAHEMKRPLTKISLPAELALADLEQVKRGHIAWEDALPKVEGHLRYILNQSMEAGSMIESIRALSMPSEAALEMTDLRLTIRHALDTERELLQKHGVAVLWDSSADVPPVPGRAGQLDIVFLNLIKNAAEAMSSLPEGRARELTIELGSDAQQAIARITDSGLGIRAEDRANLFSPHFTTKGPHGTGMGLYLSHQIIQAHNGTIDVSSDRGKGTTFRVSLPLS